MKPLVQRLVLKRMIFTTLIFVALLSLLTVYISGQSGQPLRDYLRPYFAAALMGADKLADAAKYDAIYILGGAERAQRYKFEEVAELYCQGYSRKILLMSVDRLTRYNHEQKRNLTFDEWSLLKLETLGVPVNVVEIVTLREGYFGTLSEAEGIARLARERGYRNILLVASAYHVKRVKKSFAYFLRDMDVQLTVVAAGEPAFLKGFAREWLKLKAYELLMFIDGKLGIPILAVFAAN